MKIDGNIDYGNTVVYIQAETVEEFQSAVAKLVEGAPAHFERVTQVKQAAIAAEVLGKPEEKAKSAPVERTKSSAPPSGGKRCKHGPVTKTEPGKYKYDEYCSAGKNEEKCTFEELKEAGIR